MNFVRASAIPHLHLTMTFNACRSAVFIKSVCGFSNLWSMKCLLQITLWTICIACLWFSNKHPNIFVFLGRFVEKFKLFEPASDMGVRVKVVSSKVYAISCCIDAPAETAVQKQLLCNRFLNSSWCFVVGEHIARKSPWVSYWKWWPCLKLCPT